MPFTFVAPSLRRFVALGLLGALCIAGCRTEPAPKVSAVSPVRNACSIYGKVTDAAGRPLRAG